MICAAPAPSADVPVANVGPDEVHLGFRDDDGVKVLARIDGRYFSPEVAGGFTGRVVGVGALGERTLVRRLTYAGAS